MLPVGELDEPKPLVLVVEDDADTRTMIGRQLQAAGCRILATATGQQALSLAVKYRPHVALVDVGLGDMDGRVLCQQLKGQVATADIPIIILTAHEKGDEFLCRCFESGARDFMTKPYMAVELVSRIRAALQDQFLRHAYLRLATEDFFTGLANRRQTILNITDAIAHARRDSTPSALLIADIDRCAAINEASGHDFGDDVMLTFSRLLNRNKSWECKAGRLGSDEFALVLLNSTAERALAAGQRIVKTFSAVAFDDRGRSRHFSACVGVAVYDGTEAPFDADEFLKRADVALFAAKQKGQGRVVGYWNLDPRQLPAILPSKRHSRSRPRRPGTRRSRAESRNPPTLQLRPGGSQARAPGPIASRR